MVRIDATKRERLKKLLSYHIIGDKYIDQFSQLLPIRQTEYLFQSLVPGVEGTVSIRRDEFYKFFFNQSAVIQTGTGTVVGSGPNVSRSNGKSQTNRVQHNYVLKNGVAHLLSNSIRYKPF